MGGFGDFITSLDRGTSVRVNYRGKNSYKTCPGACLSLILYATVLTYGLYMVLQLVQNNNPQVNQYKVLANSDSPIPIAELNG